MQYGSGQGDPTLREQICDVMRLEGIEAHPDDVVVTVGSQQAVDLVTRIFCDPGDVVICEAPSYVGALGVFRAYQCDVVHVEMDDDGLVPEALRAGDRRRPRRPARRSSSSTRSRTSTTRPASRCPRAPARGGPRDLPRGRRAGARGQPLRPARLRRRADAGAARRRGRRRDLPRVVLQDLRPRLPGRLGARPARRTREAGAGPGVGDAVPAVVHPDGGLGVPRRRTTGRARSSSSARCTASAATR